jgi:hypothetical protein
MGGMLYAEEKVVTGRFVVSLSAEGNQKAWIVNALEENVYNDLSGYGRVIPFRKVIEEDQCENRDIDCILEVYKKLNVDALMLGTVDDSEIEYEIYDIQNKFLINTGDIEIGTGSSLLKLRMGAFNAFKSFIEKGGILEKRKYSAIADGEGNEINDQVLQKISSEKLRIQVLIALAVFTCFPYFLSFIGKPLRHPERSRIVLRWFYPFQIGSLLVISYQFLLETIGGGNIFDVVLDLFEGYHWILAGLGGIVWGSFLIINFKIVIPHLQGIERIRPNNLYPLLKACLATILVKTLVIAAFYSGVFYAVSYIGRLYAVSQELMVMFLFPISGLYIFYWAALMLDVFSMSIDIRLAGRKLDFESVWNERVRKYFIGYLKRNGVTLNKHLVEEIVFLAGDNQGVVCYGGGFGRPRISIEKDLIRFALGDIRESNVEDTADYDQKAIEPVPRQNSVFQIIANLSHQGTRKKIFKSRYDRKRIKRLESVQNLFQRDLKFAGSEQNDRIENVMQGMIIPRFESDDDIPSLMSDNSADMRVVEELLLEYSWRNDRYDEDAEVDDANEHDKDFLFGALLHKFGELLRHEDIFSTLYLYLPRRKGAKRRSYNFLFSRYFAIVADTFVVLNFGLNHLMQYLYFQATNDSSQLTIKGITSCMLKNQDEILTSTKEITEQKKPATIQTDELERIIWLSRFCQGSIEKQEQNDIRARRIIKWSLSLGVTYLASIVLINSYIYHPRYVEIIANEQQEIADAIKDAQEKERKEK